jgi:hypothetical protein
MGISFQNGTIHECAGVSLVGVAADVFDGSRGGGGKLPLGACGESRPASAAEARGGDDLDDFLRRLLREAGPSGLMTPQLRRAMRCCLR